MTRLGTSVWLLAVALLATACGQVQGPPATDRPAAAQKVLVASQVVAPQAVIAVPRILNPTEELNAFAPDGILRWTEAAGADAYEVWVYSWLDRDQLIETSATLTSRQYQFTKLAPHTEYWIDLYCRVDGRWEHVNMYPAVRLFTTDTVVKPRLLNSQEEIEAFAVGGTLRWTPIDGADRYEVWIYADRGLRAMAATSGPLQITQYTAAGLVAGMTYYVKVYSRVAGVYHVGAATPVVAVAESNRARILNPQEELDAFAPTGILRWTPVAGATSYEAWIYDNPNVSEIRESSGGLTTRSYATRTLMPASVYYAQVYALVNGEWQVGAPVKLTIAPQVIVARLTNPQEELESFATDGTLRWSEVPGADRYEVWLYGNAGLGVVAEAGFSAQRSYQVTRLCRNAAYFAQVHARVNGQWTAGWATRLEVKQGESPANCVPPAPMVTLSASSSEVSSGESVTLSWTSRFAGSCTAFGDWSGARPTSGTATVGPLSKVTRYSLVCDGPSGSTPAQQLVMIRIPRFTLTALPMQQAVALNDLGDVAGNNFVREAGTNSPRSCAYINGELIVFNFGIESGVYRSTARDINIRREVVISTSASSDYLYRDGMLVRLDPSFAVGAINDRGHIVGAADAGLGEPAGAAILTDGTVTRLTMPAGTASHARAVTEQGVIAGDRWPVGEPGKPRAFLHAGGTMTDLGTLGGDTSRVAAINEAGTVVGSARLADGRDHAFRFGLAGMSDLGSLGGATSAASGLNDAGVIVGSAGTDDGSTHAFLFDHEMMYDLNDYLEDPMAMGIPLTEARDINSQGQIVANACWFYPIPGCQPYLLTPAEGSSPSPR